MASKPQQRLAKLALRQRGNSASTAAANKSSRQTTSAGCTADPRLGWVGVGGWVERANKRCRGGKTPSTCALSNTAHARTHM
jgi:hypothetical protein